MPVFRRISLVLLPFLLLTAGLAPPAEAGQARKSRIIVIDPGHGGHDPGAVGPAGLREKDITLAFARHLVREISARPGFKAVLTRRGDHFLPLARRVAFARARSADLFISIHADSNPDHRVGGFAIYSISDKASDAHAARLSRRENAAGLVPGLGLEHALPPAHAILIDLARRESRTRSQAAARALLPHIPPAAPLLDPPHRFADFHVLSAPDVPSLLLELGFLSNRRDAQNLANPRWQAKLARRIARSLDRFFRPELASTTKKHPQTARLFLLD